MTSGRLDEAEILRWRVIYGEADAEAAGQLRPRGPGARAKTQEHVNTFFLIITSL